LSEPVIVGILSANQGKGRKFFKKRAARVAKNQGKTAPVLHDIDFLLGVADSSRMGALGFSSQSWIHN